VGSSLQDLLGPLPFENWICRYIVRLLSPNKKAMQSIGMAFYKIHRVLSYFVKERGQKKPA
jgi:hypothetical protein